MSDEMRNDRNDDGKTVDVGGVIKIISFILIVSALLGFIIWAIAGGGRDDEGEDDDVVYDEAEVRAAAIERLKESVLLNEIFYGAGMPEADGASDDLIGGYVPIDPAYAEAHGLNSVDDLRLLMQNTFSYTIYGDLERLFLTGATLDGVNYSHYIDGQGEEDGNGNREHLGIFVWIKRATNVDSKVRPTQTTSFDYDSLSVIGAEGKRVRVEVDCTVTDSMDGRVVTVRRALYLVNEYGRWKLDSHSVKLI